MITAENSPECLHTVLNAGADDYLTKPLSIGILNIRLTIAEQKAIELARRKEAESRVNELHAKIR